MLNFLVTKLMPILTTNSKFFVTQIHKIGMQIQSQTTVLQYSYSPKEQKARVRIPPVFTEIIAMPLCFIDLICIVCVFEK
jgi:hypothetical protein